VTNGVTAAKHAAAANSCNVLQDIAIWQVTAMQLKEPRDRSLWEIKSHPLRHPFGSSLILPYEEAHKRQGRDLRAIAPRKDEDIDFSDVPPVLDRSKAEIGKFYSPAKKTVTLRLDSDIIASLKYLSAGKTRQQTIKT
jgi:uncharacterized protein (DUF4415 family)